MKIPSLMRRATLAVAVFAAIVPFAVQAQSWPQKPVRLIVPFAAGGPSDALARAFARNLADNIGQPVIVDNRGGGGGAIGIDAVAKAAPDGYTLGFAHTGTTAINPHVMAKHPYDPLTDLTVITPIVSYANVLVLNDKVPARTVKEFVAWAKANPNDATYGTGGSGTTNHLAGELLKMLTGDVLANLTTTQMVAITSAQIQALSTTQINTLVDTEIAALKTSQIAGLTGTQLKAMGTPQYDGFTSTQLQALVSPQITSLTTDNMSYFTSSQIVGFKAPQIAMLTTTQLQALTPSAVAAITAAQVVGLSVADVKSFTVTQVAALSATAIGAFSAIQARALTTTQVAAMTADQVSQSTYSFLKAAILGH